MGFGSYDESEQENQQKDIDTDESEQVSTKSYNGKVTFEAESVDELMEQYKENKDEDEDE